MESFFYRTFRERLAKQLDLIERGGEGCIIKRRNNSTSEVRETAVLISKAEYDRLVALEGKSSVNG